MNSTTLIGPWRHPDSGIYWYRRRVPAGVVIPGANGKPLREFKQSLKTTDRREADRRWSIKHAEVEQTIADATTGRLKVLTEDKIAAITAEWFQTLWFGEPDEDREGPYTREVKEFSGYQGLNTNLTGWLNQNGHDLTEADHGRLLRHAEQIYLTVTLAKNRNTPAAKAVLHPEIRTSPFDPVLYETPAPREDKTKPPVAVSTGGLMELFETYANERNLPMKTRDEFRRACSMFVDLNRDPAVSVITRGHGRNFRDHLKGMLSRMGEPLSMNSKIKMLGGVKAVLGYAVREEIIETNPLEGITFEKPKVKPARSRIDWSTEALETLFGSGIYTGRERPRGGGGQAAYWLAPLSLHMGARLNELAQLKVTDVVTVSSILCLSITDEGDDQSIKSTSSRRIVPLPKAILDLGFAKYVEGAKKRDPKGRLFPDITPGKYTISAPWSKWFGRYCDEIGITDKRIVFHSLRHTFISACRRVMDEEVRNRITGHSDAGESVGRSYGEHDVAMLKKAIDLVSFPVSISQWKA